MKPEHFIYKSDGLYYIKDMPEKEYYETHGHFDRITASKDGMSAYNEALERAKAEAVLVTDPYVYQIAMHRYFPHFIDYSKTPQDNFAMYATQGQVYTINMEEKIEVYEFKLVEMCNFPEDYAHENGNYINKCHSCGFYFKGHKRRVTCKMCSEFTLEEWKKIAAMKTPEDTKHAHAGCWLQGEMVGYARCMVKWLESAPKKEEESEDETKSIRGLFNIFAGAWISCAGPEEYKIIEAIKEKFEIKRKPL